MVSFCAKHVTELEEHKPSTLRPYFNVARPFRTQVVSKPRSANLITCRSNQEKQFALLRFEQSLALFQNTTQETTKYAGCATHMTSRVCAVRTRVYENDLFRSQISF
jgi:hypothetical protein